MNVMFNSFSHHILSQKSLNKVIEFLVKIFWGPNSLLNTVKKILKLSHNSWSLPASLVSVLYTSTYTLYPHFSEQLVQQVHHVVS